jgi:hypothetical protein
MRRDGSCERGTGVAGCGNEVTVNGRVVEGSLRVVVGFVFTVTRLYSPACSNVLWHGSSSERLVYRKSHSWGLL